MLKLLKDRRWYMRIAAARALGEIGNDRAVGPLSTFVKENVRSFPVGAAAAAEALGKLGSADAVEPLIVAFAGGVPEAMIALMQIDPNWPATPSARKSVPAVIQRLEDKEDGGANTNAIAILGAVRDPRALTPLLEMIGRSGHSEPLLAALGQLDPRWPGLAETRRQVPRLIRQITSMKPGKPVVPAGTGWEEEADLSDQAKKQKDLAAEAAYFLGKIGDPAAVKPLVGAYYCSAT